MAKSGSFTTTSKEGRSLTFNWSVKSQSVANNQTTINWSLVGSGSYTAGWVTCGSFKVTIDGKQVYYSSTRINVYSNQVIASGTYTFTHNNDGNKSFTAYVEAAIFDFAVNCSGSGTYSLPQIARQATITSAPNFTDIQNPTISYSNPLGASATRLRACISLTGNTDDVPYRDIPKTGTNYTFNLTDEERTTLRQAAANSKSITVYFYVATFIGSNIYRSNIAKTLTIVDANPLIESVTYQDSNSKTSAITENNQQLIQNQSTLQLTITGVSPQKSSTIKKVEYSINGYNVDITNSYATPVLIGTINYSTNFNLSVIVTDSRGYITTKTIEVQMLAWKLPYATINLARKNNFYNETDMQVNAFYSSLNNKNSINIKYQYKKVTESEYGAFTTISNNTPATVNVDNLYDFNFKFVISDLFGSTTYNVTLPKGIPLAFFDRFLSSISFNGFPTKENGVFSSGLQIDDKIFIGSQIIYDKFTATTATTATLLGAYDYNLIDRLFNGITIPEGYERAYRITFQVTTSSSNKVTVSINNISSPESGTWSQPSYMVFASTRIFKESELVLEPTYGYTSKDGLNLKITNSAAGNCTVNNITVQGYLVKTTDNFSTYDMNTQEFVVEG